MDLFVLILSILVGSIAFVYFIYGITEYNEKGYIKRRDFFRMSNAGKDPCEKNQVVISRNRYCTSGNWVLEEE